MSAASVGDQLSRDPSMPDVPYDAVQSAVLVRSEHSIPHSETLPEHRLMIALVRDAIRCIQKYRHARDSRGKRLFAQEAQWILSDDMDWLYAFARICEALGLDPDAVRRSLAISTDCSNDGSSRDATRTAPTVH